MKISDSEYRMAKEKIDPSSFEDCLEYYNEEGVCMWCLGDKYVMHELSNRDYVKERCPICNRDEPDDDYQMDIMNDR